jgi:hypothetical protein
LPALKSLLQFTIYVKEFLFFMFYSTISSGYNAVAAILLEDFVKPSFPNMKSSTMTIFSKIVSKYIHICFGWFMVYGA